MSLIAWERYSCGYASDGRVYAVIEAVQGELAKVRGVRDRLRDDDASALMDERTFIDWVRLLRDGWIALAAFLVAGAGVGTLATLLQPTEYRYTGTVVLSPARGFLDPSGADALPAITDTVARLLKTNAVLDRTRSAYVSAGTNGESRVRQLETEETTWLRDHLRASPVAGSSIIRVSGTAATDSDARDLTRAAVRSLVQTVARSQSGGSNAGIHARIFSMAEAEGKVSPAQGRNLLIGLNAGLILGVVAALGVGAAMRRIRRPEEVAAALGLPLLAWIRTPAWGSAGVDGRMVDARARLQFLFYKKPGAILLVTGTLAGDEVAQVCEWIAGSVAAAGGRAVLVNADLSGRAVAEPLNEVGQPGVADTLDDLFPDPLTVERSRWSKLRKASSDPSPTPSGPVRVLALSALNGGLDSLRTHYDAIVVAGPGLDRAAEVISLLRTTDRVVVVAARGDRARRLEEANAFLTSQVDREKLEGAIVVDPARFAA